jgi:hypothetical protein
MYLSLKTGFVNYQLQASATQKNLKLLRRQSENINPPSLPQTVLLNYTPSLQMQLLGE